MGYYNINKSQLGVLTTYYSFSYAPMQLFVGLMIDRYGTKRLLSLASVICGIGTYMFAFSPELWMAQLGRFLVGLGSAFAYVGVLKLAIMWLTSRGFAFFSGITMASGTAMGMLSDNLLTYMLNTYGWEQTNVFFVLFGLILSVALYVVLSSKPPASENNSNESAVSFYEHVSKSFSLLAMRQIWINGFIGCMLWISIAIYADQWGIMHLKDALGFSDVQAAKINGCLFLGWATGGPIVGIITSVLGRRKPLIVVGSVVSTILSLMIAKAWVTTQFNLMLVLFLLGLFSSPQVLAFPIARENCNDKISGASLAFTNMIIMLSGFLQPIPGYIIDMYADSLSIQQAYGYGLMIMPICLAAAFIASFFLKETYGKTLH